MRDRGSPAIGLASLAGVVAFCYPFWLPAVAAATDTTAHAEDAPLLLAGLGLLLAIALLQAASERAGRAGAAKLVALLGVLVAVNATLRLLPSFGGASPIFLLIMLVGYAYGATHGFLMGALTLLTSAFITGGIGPWLPYQMVTAGWVGLTAGWLPDLRHHPWRERLTLAVFGVVWGVLFGVVINLWFWPFVLPTMAEGGEQLYWRPGLGIGEAVQRYATFYLITSLPYDLLRALANLLLLLTLAPALLFVLRRFERRFTWQPILRLDEVEGEADKDRSSA